jgi:predicted ABC-type ATPase
MPETKPNGSGLSTAHLALREAQRSIDNAVQSIFELAYSLESLREAIARAKIESYRLQLFRPHLQGSSTLPSGKESVSS